MWSSFSGLILQTGGTEEVYKEQKRQQELENNYKFVWGESQEESQASSTSDSDDVDIWANWPRLVHIKYLSTPVETCRPGLWFRNLTGGHQITPLHLQKTCLRVLNRQFVSSRRHIKHQGGNDVANVPVLETMLSWISWCIGLILFWLDHLEDLMCACLRGLCVQVISFSLEWKVWSLFTYDKLDTNINLTFLYLVIWFGCRRWRCLWTCCSTLYFSTSISPQLEFTFSSEVSLKQFTWKITRSSPSVLVSLFLAKNVGKEMTAVNAKLSWYLRWI